MYVAHVVPSTSVPEEPTAIPPPNLRWRLNLAAKAIEFFSSNRNPAIAAVVRCSTATVSREIRPFCCRDADAEIAAYTGGTVDPARFRPPDAPKWPGHWKEHAEPSPLPRHPRGSVLGNELVAVARRELDKLPERQRIVVTLRDILGFDSGEVCELLQISVANQRVLLHRGRAAVRQVLEDYLGEVSLSTGPMDCNEVVELVTAYLDESLDPEDAGPLRPTPAGMRRLPELPPAVPGNR